MAKTSLALLSVERDPNVHVTRGKKKCEKSRGDNFKKFAVLAIIDWWRESGIVTWLQMHTARR